MSYSVSSVRGDIFGGVTAAVVALPLALAFGVASGAGPIAELYGAIAEGVFEAVFSGTPAQVLGPTGLPDLRIPFPTIINLTSIVQPACVLVLLGSIGSLLTPLVADFITRTQYKSDRELIGQNIGNMVTS